MSLQKVGKATKIKKVVYLILFAILGILFSILIYALIETSYLRWTIKKEVDVKFYNSSAYIILTQSFIFLLGSVAGYFSGLYWWRKIYIERFWEKIKK